MHGPRLIIVIFKFQGNFTVFYKAYADLLLSRWTYFLLLRIIMFLRQKTTLYCFDIENIIIINIHSYQSVTSLELFYKPEVYKLNISYFNEVCKNELIIIPRLSKIKWTLQQISSIT